MTDIIASSGEASDAIAWGDERLPQRFWDKTKTNDQDCWTWTGFINHNGYGQYQLDKQSQRAHRVAYAALVGAIPEGHVLDHLCRVRHCVNPGHLEVVTPQENTRRMGGPGGYQQAVCHRGHQFTNEDAYIDRHGRRQCRACRKIRNKESRERVRARRMGGAS